MATQVIDGRALAAKIRERTVEKLNRLHAAGANIYIGLMDDVSRRACVADPADAAAFLRF